MTTERLRESLSALMDDEADDLELGRVLRAMDEEGASVRETWSRYQMVSAVMRGIPSAGFAAAASGGRYADISAAIADDAIADDAITSDAVAAKAAPATGTDDAAARLAADAPAAAGSASRPWMSFAAAAGVTLALVVGFQWQGAGEGDDAAPARVVSVPTDPGPVQTDPRGVLTANAERGVERTRPIGALRIPSPLAGAAPSTPAPDARRQVDAYMLFHAEMSALNSATGMVPFARYAAFEGAPRN